MAWNFYREGDTGWNNLVNALDKIWDFDWFYRDGNEHSDEIALFDSFIDDFLDYLTDEGVDLYEYKNKPFDIKYYFESYMNSDRSYAINDLYSKVEDWLSDAEEYASSRDYLDSMYLFENGAASVEFYTNDVKDNAERCFRLENTHGFNSAKDLEDAVWKAIDDGNLCTYDVYDGGSMGYHSSEEGDGEYFETGYCFLGNGEEEYQLDESVPFSDEYDYNNVLNNHIVHGDLLYVSSTLVYCYGVKWSDVEAAGDELGVRNGAASESEINLSSEEDIPRF